MPSISTAATSDYERDLSLMGAEDSMVSGEAFGRLWERVQEPLKRGLLSSGLGWEDADDHLQTVRIRLWERRNTLDVPSPGAWWALVRKISRNLAIDRARSNGDSRNLTLDDAPDIPEQDMPYVDAIVLASHDLRRVYDAADDLWLGETSKNEELNLLAAQLCLLDGFDRKTVAHLLQITTDEIDRALSNPSVLRRLAYRELFWTNDALAGFVLRPEKPFSPSQLDDLVRLAREGNGTPPDGWEWPQVLVMLLRIRNGLLAEQILRFEKCGMDGQELENVLAQINEQFPFEAIAENLLKRQANESVSEALANLGLWKRLAFQYHVSSELPNRQIQERIGPAASVVGAKLTEAMLNNWIGLGRLWTQLAIHVQQDDKR